MPFFLHGSSCPLVHTHGEVQVLPLHCPPLLPRHTCWWQCSTNRTVYFMQGYSNQPGLLTSLFTKGNIIKRLSLAGAFSTTLPHSIPLSALQNQQDGNKRGVPLPSCPLGALPGYQGSSTAVSATLAKLQYGTQLPGRVWLTTYLSLLLSCYTLSWQTHFLP